MTDGSGESGSRGESEQPPTEPPAGRDGPSPESQDNADTDVDEEWRFGVDDVDEDGVIDTSIEPETITTENAAFVVLGIVIAVLILARTVTVFA